MMWLIVEHSSKISMVSCSLRMYYKVLCVPLPPTKSVEPVYASPLLLPMSLGIIS
jgi:hypothetical protein